MVLSEAVEIYIMNCICIHISRNTELIFFFSTFPVSSPELYLFNFRRVEYLDEGCRNLFVICRVNNSITERLERDPSIFFTIEMLISFQQDLSAIQHSEWCSTSSFLRKNLHCGDCKTYIHKNAKAYDNYISKCIGIVYSL